MKKYDQFLATLLLFCSFMVSLYGMQHDVKYALHELRKRLDDLRFALKESQTGLKDLPYELTEKMLLDSIPTLKGTTPSEVAKVFLDTVRSLRNFSRTNKTYYNIFLEPMFKRAVIRKLFNDLSFEMLKNIPMPNKISADESVFGDISNALYYIYSIHSNLARVAKIITSRYGAYIDERDERFEYIHEGLQKLVHIGISPNFFVDYRNLFHIALVYDFPKIVIDMITKGADVTMRTKNYEAGRLLASSPIVTMNFNQIPFVLAFSYSPESALFLLNQKSVDKEAIKDHITHAWAYYKTHNDSEAVRHHVKYYVQIVKKLVENGIDANTEIVVTVRNDMAIKNSFLALFLSYYDKYSRGPYGEEDPEILEVIGFLLDNKAKINKGYYMVDWGKMWTPLEFARAQKGSYPELYNLIEKYKDNPDNN